MMTVTLLATILRLAEPAATPSPTSGLELTVDTGPRWCSGDVTVTVRITNTSKRTRWLAVDRHVDEVPLSVVGDCGAPTAASPWNAANGIL
jgi:hypothetical protein